MIATIEKIKSSVIWFFGIIFAVKLWERYNFNKGVQYEKMDYVNKRVIKNKEALKKANLIKSRRDMRKRVHNKTY